MRIHTIFNGLLLQVVIVVKIFIQTSFCTYARIYLESFLEVGLLDQRDVYIFIFERHCQITLLRGFIKVCPPDRMRGLFSRFLSSTVSYNFVFYLSQSYGWKWNLIRFLT